MEQLDILDSWEGGWPFCWWDPEGSATWSVLFQGGGWHDIEFPSLFDSSSACDLNWSEVLSWIEDFLTYDSNTWPVDSIDYAHVVMQDLGSNMIGALRRWGNDERLHNFGHIVCIKVV